MICSLTPHIQEVIHGSTRLPQMADGDNKGPIRSKQTGGTEGHRRSAAGGVWGRGAFTVSQKGQKSIKIKEVELRARNRKNKRADREISSSNLLHQHH